jgi:hypothetical protein
VHKLLSCQKSSFKKPWVVPEEINNQAQQKLEQAQEQNALPLGPTSTQLQTSSPTSDGSSSSAKKQLHNRK